MKSRKLSQALAPWLFLSPAALFFLVFILRPIMLSVLLSFYRWEGFGEAEFIGLANYDELLNDERFWLCIRNNVIWFMAALIVPPIALGVAIMLRQKFWGIKAIRSIFFMPLVIPAIAQGLIFNWLYEPRYGFISWVIQSLGYMDVEFALLADEATVTYAIVACSLFVSIAFASVFFMTGLAKLNHSLIEAGRMDGAKNLALFYYVVWPQLKPSIFLAYITSIVNALRSFDLIFIMTQGGPYGTSSVLSYFMYREALFNYRYGYGAAIACVLLSLTLVVILWILYNYRREVS